MSEQPPSGQPPYQGGNPPPGQPPYQGGNPPPPPGQSQYPYGGNNQPPPAPGPQPPYGGTYPGPPPSQSPYGGTPPGYGPPPPGYGPPPAPGSQPPYGTGYPPPYVQPPPKRGRATGWIIGIIALVVVLVLACVVGFGALIGVGVSAKADAEKTLDEFMKVAAAGNADAAYALVAPNITKEQFKSGFVDPTSGYLPDYDSLNTSGFSVNTNNGATTATLSGTVRYKTKGTGPFEATLEQVNSKWRIVKLDVKVPA